ncbi:MAG: RHS repeat-associated core domain-containing protein [Bacillota bacterium]|nr:RHS repeat-associated core domain-containing protein [Bacillota bacterium]
MSEETDASGNVIARYTYDDKGTPVSVTEGGKVYNYQYNGHGDVVALTDSNGNVVATFTYDVWGNVTDKTGNLDNLFGYAGQFGYVYDQETGFYFLKSRYYDPKIGRFTTKDRFRGFEDRPTSQNQYTYCENDPVMNIDPDGHKPIGIIKYYWWGMEGIYTHKEADEVQYQFSQFANGSGLVGVFTVRIPVVAAALGGYWAYYSMLANAISHHNGKKGVIVDMSYTALFKVYSR